MRASLSIVLLLVACSASTGEPDAGNPDAGTPDAGSPDAGSPDAGSPDGGGSTEGSITLLAGSADGPGNHDGPRASARFALPTGVAKLPDGSLLVADRSAGTLRRVGTDGVVTTFAGRSGDLRTVDGPLAAARFRGPAALAVATDGSIYVSDASASVVRRISPQGQVATLAGADLQDGTADGTGAAARFRSPEAIALRSDGALLVADAGAHTLRLVGTDGTVTTFAGAPDESGTADGARAEARFSGPRGLAVASDGTVAVADTDSNTLRFIDAEGNVVTAAGNATEGQDYADGTGADARFAGPRGVVFLANGDVLVADSQNDRVRRVTRAGVVTTFASAGNGQDDGARGVARFQFPWGLLVDGDSVYVCDSGNSTVRRISEAAVETFAGTPTRLGTADGVGSAARFFFPTAVAAREDGMLVVADTQNHTLRTVAPDGTTSTWVGIAGSPGSVDGSREEAGFDAPAGLVADGAGGFFVSDQNAHLIRRVAADGSVETWAGGPSRGGAHADGPRLDARFAAPAGLARDAAGNLFVADSRNHMIRRIGTDGEVTTIAGDGYPGASDGEGSTARFHYPQAVAVGADGTLFVADTMNHLLRKITFAAGLATVTTLAGTLPFNDDPVPGYADGSGYGAAFDGPSALAWDEDGTLVVADSYNDVLRRVTTAGVVTTVAGHFGESGVRTGALPGSLFEPTALAPLGAGRFAVTFLTGVLVVQLE